MSVQKAIAGRALVIPLNINVEIGQLLVRVSNAQGRHTEDAAVTQKAENTYEIKFIPPEAGVYKMEIMVKGTTKQTVTINADPAPYLRLLGSQHMTNAIVGQQVEFKIEYPVGTLSSDQIEASFRDEHGSVAERTYVANLGEGKFAVRFTPPKPGKYTTKVSIKGAGTMDGQLEIDAQQAPGIQLIEGASGLATVGKPFTFKLSAPAIRLNQLEVAVQTPVGRTDRASASDLGHGIFAIVYTPSVIGKYTAEIKLDGGLISKPLLIDSRSDVRWMSQLPTTKGELLVGKDFDFHIEVNGPSNSDISVSITNADHQQVHHGRLQHAGGSGDTHQFSLKWRPPTGGYYGCQIELDGKPLGEKVIVYAAEPKADTGGKNTSKGKLGNVFTVTVTLEDMETKKITASVQDEDGRGAGQAQVEREGHGKYKISYKPEKIGMHKCTLEIDGVSVSGSDLYFDVHS